MMGFVETVGTVLLVMVIVAVAVVVIGGILLSVNRPNDR